MATLAAQLPRHPRRPLAGRRHPRRRPGAPALPPAARSRPESAPACSTCSSRTRRPRSSRWSAIRPPPCAGWPAHERQSDRPRRAFRPHGEVRAHPVRAAVRAGRRGHRRPRPRPDGRRASLGIVVAMAGARTAAMGFNRIVDRDIDARNPRTAGREMPRRADRAAAPPGRSPWSRRAVFVAAAAALGPLCLALSPVALALLFGYSFTKRFTALCHLFLGLAIARGPGRRLDRGARRLRLGARPADARRRLLDRRLRHAVRPRRPRLRSRRRPALDPRPPRRPGRAAVSAAPARRDRRRAVRARSGGRARRPLHRGRDGRAALLVYEHAIVRPSDLSRLDVAFFNLNGYVSVAFLAATLVDVLVR